MPQNNGVCNPVIRKGNIIYGPSLDGESFEGGLGAFIYNACQKYADKICQISADTNESETYSSFLRRSIKVAIKMRKIGVKKSDVILNCTPNNLESALPVAAALYNGAIVASLDPTLSDRDCVHLINSTGPKVIFTHEDSVPLIEATLEQASLKPLIVVMGRTEKYMKFEEFLADFEEEANFEPTEVNKDDTAFILFSSGTTGMPKGICLSNYSLYTTSKIYLGMINNEEILMHFTTFYWISAVFIFISQFFNGAHRVLIKAFDTENTFKLIEKYKVASIFMASAYTYKIPLVKDLDKCDTSNLKSIVFGGGPVHPDQMQKVKELLPHTYCHCGYGMTEIAGFATAFCPNDKALLEKHPSSCGRPVTGIKIKVVDNETGKVLGPNKSGEVRLFCPYKMLGYYNLDSSSAFDEEGYIKSGDIGHYDEDLCLYVYDRIKDMFKYQCWHIIPASIETVIKEHPDVIDAVVFGLPAPNDDNIPAAAVTVVDGSSTTAEDIEKFVEERVLDRQRLRGGVYFFKDIPKTPTFKISRKKVQETVIEKYKLK